MGEARRRGTLEERKAEAIAAGRGKGGDWKPKRRAFDPLPRRHISALEISAGIILAKALRRGNIR